MPAREPAEGVEVQAAGGVVWRRAGGRLEVVLVHRPRYDDWTLPKGKLDPGETHLVAALREVAEETGLRCSAGPELPPTAYADAQARPKLVRYWAMTVDADDGFEPDDEVDELRWAELPSARETLSYPRDAALLDALPAALDAP